MKRIYIAGPITLGGTASERAVADNIARFQDAATAYRAAGWDVASPVELDPPEGEGWTAWMRVCIALLVTCDEILMLPGWSLSKGAKLERAIAKGLGMKVQGSKR